MAYRYRAVCIHPPPPVYRLAQRIDRRIPEYPNDTQQTVMERIKELDRKLPNGTWKVVVTRSLQPIRSCTLICDPELKEPIVRLDKPPPPPLRSVPPWQNLWSRHFPE
jgi:hypothetical protein